jgi:2'-5' RNA ligase
MAESAFAVNVPEAEPYVGALRRKFDPAAALGMPAHITVLYPFMPPEEITQAVLGGIRRALSVASPFSFTLARVDRFADALYLAPEPAAPFVALTRSLVGQFPGYLPYGGKHAGIVPHLTVAQAARAEHDIAEAQLAATLPGAGIPAKCGEVVLIENSSGLWKPMHSFALAG